jgi:hypothetical protein
MNRIATTEITEVTEAEAETERETEAARRDR